MKILISPDKFKGSLDANEVAEIISRVLSECDPQIECHLQPIADGGEGTARILTAALGGQWHEMRVRGPMGNGEVAAGLGLAATPDGLVACFEMASAAGHALVPAADRDPWAASTYGVGQLILAAMDAGADKIIVGLGGSATNDGGSGMARALGMEFLDGNGQPLDDLPRMLMEAKDLLVPLDKVFPEIIAAADVENPLLGPNGATAIFGPQKGVTSAMQARHEERLRHFADLVERELHVDIRETPGAGAAGGLGFGLMAICGAKLASGFDLVADAIDLSAAIKQADVVITGEGSLDAQSLLGKGPGAIARMARTEGKKVFAFCGRAVEREKLADFFDGVFQISPDAVPVEESILHAAAYLEEAVRANASAILGD